MEIENEKPLLIEKRKSALWLTFNRPQAMNALTQKMMILMDQAMDQAEADADIRSLVLTGTGRAFCAGVDLTAIGGNLSAADATAAFMKIAAPVARRLSHFPIPTIAAVNGIALAGGLEMALNCDLSIASSKAKFGDAHANFGLIPGGGSSVKLPKRVGISLANYMVLTGEFMDAETMRASGLLLRVVAPEDLEASVNELAEKLGEKSPLGLTRSKQLLRQGQELPEDEAMLREAELAIEQARSNDAKVGMMAFAAKRKPEFTGT